MDTHDTPEKDYDLERLLFFTDGVFAIVITLLAIELHPPEHWDRTLSSLWAAESRSLVAYAVSFLAVGAYWNSHRMLFRRVVRFHPGLVVLNLLLLGLVVLLPFSAELIFESGPRGEPFAIYLGLIAAIGLAQALLWGFAAFVAKVVTAKLDVRSRLTIFLAMAGAPAVICGISYMASRGTSSNWIWAVPAIAALAFLRRRLMRVPTQS